MFALIHLVIYMMTSYRLKVSLKSMWFIRLIK
uniref:Uncharacterized protein n=1 Tax=Arundo donax TaxID=35708 RepID=A0A0A9D8H2_ARUDO